MDANQIIMLYTLNLHSAVCQLYLNKTWEKRSLKKCFYQVYNNTEEACVIILSELIRIQ